MVKDTRLEKGKGRATTKHEKLNDAREWGMAALRKEIECLLAEQSGDDKDTNSGGEEASNSDLYETDTSQHPSTILCIRPTSSDPASSSLDPQHHPPTHQPQPTVTPQCQAVTRTPRGGHRKQWEAYVVYHGRSVGAFGSWRQVEAIIKDDENSVIKGFQSLSLAKQSYQLASTSGVLNAISFQLQTGEPHWVVTQGIHPGVYKTRHEVIRDGLYYGRGAVYPHNNAKDANAFFVAEYMAECVLKLEPAFVITPLN
ncbi:hypothetical protein D9758_012357 [Tetrapyrgos nigripes]|uniref:Ribonuclease H1 N-terminal domain-containing protein n=1 Tax=Tetrapyrgos nigripes TaxID=182062 RepID=A0A8H5CNQ1_9AGAR|nr:hypothetical protein D9758_012357 [Tetrapyrgos nigripes]